MKFYPQWPVRITEACHIFVVLLDRERNFFWDAGDVHQKIVFDRGMCLVLTNFVIGERDAVVAILLHWFTWQRTCTDVVQETTHGRKLPRR
ncbi:hypothetical protein BH10BDE1_BH10BDE1_17410 [soil metagenome]